jgi:hypothetical protein
MTLHNQGIVNLHFTQQIVGLAINKIIDEEDLLINYFIIGCLTVNSLPLAIASHAVQTASALRATIAQNAARLACNFE